jgi:hypothetical protein
MRRGRRSEDEIQAGDVLDGYTVEKADPGHMIRLRNDMKAPGPAWMQFEVLISRNGKTLFIQTAFFEPHGLAGLAYWYGLYPFHQIIFNGLPREIIKHSESVARLEITDRIRGGK